MKTEIMTIAALAAAMGFAEPDNAQWVRPLVGTAYNGHTFPGATYPFGLVQPSPDTGRFGWDYCSGYRYDDEAIIGFSQTHLNGTGGIDLGDVRLMPGVAPSRYSKESQVCEPGYYAVTLDDAQARVEITAAPHTALYRVTALRDGSMRLLVDCQYGLGWGETNSIAASDVRLECGVLSGTNRRCGWVVRDYSFAVRFDRSFAASEVLAKRAECEKAPRYVFTFDMRKGDALNVAIGYSTVSPEGAKKNMEAEMKDFDDVRSEARAAWNALLGRIEVEGSEDAKENFYTALYHLFVQPNNIADVDGGYRGADGRVAFARGGEYYSTLSLWDTYRAANPLYTIITPEKVDGFVTTMVAHQEAAGFLPIWTLMGIDNQCMVGTHSVPVIVDAYLKGFRGFEPEEAYRAIKATLRESHEARKKENWVELDRYGYYPNDIVKSESVARLLECAYDDWCASLMARRLGHGDDAAFFAKRAGNWRNVLDPETKFMRGRDSAGRWTTPFSPFALGHNETRRNDFTEGNSWQWTWHVMHDPAGLIDALGGRDAALAKLLALFEQPEETEDSGFVADATGLIGQYAHGNEPSHHVIYFFQYLGRGERTAELVREVFDKFYLPRPDGLCGNDDCGQMSAWYIFSALGFYPFNPCGGEYVIGAPQIPKATLKLRDGKTFTVTAKNLTKENKYVKRVWLNGRKLDSFILRHEDVMAGGELVFEMEER